MTEGREEHEVKRAVAGKEWELLEGGESSRMKLPNGDRAHVDLRKLEAYCLNEHHPRGKHKARVFASCGITDAEALKRALLEAAVSIDVIESDADQHGTLHIIEFHWMEVLIRSIWMVRENEDFPRLVSCYIP